MVALIAAGVTGTPYAPARCITFIWVHLQEPRAWRESQPWKQAVPEFPEIGVAHVIQLAVAPVFLLSGIGAMLAVMTNRLGRIIDRARVLEEKLAGAPEFAARLRADLAILSRRAKLISRAITLCTTTALLVCAVIATLFLSVSLHFNATIPVTILFIAAMTTFFAGLLWFLREIYLATVNLRIGAR